MVLSEFRLLEAPAMVLFDEVVGDKDDAARMVN